MSDEAPQTQAIVRTRPRGPITWPDCVPELKAAFLEEFVRNGGVQTPAAKAVGINQRTILNWRNKDPEFALAYEEAKQEANDTIRREISRRAIEGWDEPVYQGGKLVGHTRKYSDALLQFLAKSRMPEFRDKLDVTSNDQHINAHETIVEAVNDEQTTALAAQFLEHIAHFAHDTGRAGDTGE